MIIYRIFNKINGKSYIGQSIFKFNKRYKLINRINYLIYTL